MYLLSISSELLHCLYVPQNHCRLTGCVGLILLVFLSGRAMPCCCDPEAMPLCLYDHIRKPCSLLQCLTSGCNWAKQTKPTNQQKSHRLEKRVQNSRMSIWEQMLRVSLGPMLRNGLSALRVWIMATLTTYQNYRPFKLRLGS